MHKRNPDSAVEASDCSLQGQMSGNQYSRSGEKWDTATVSLTPFLNVHPKPMCSFIGYMPCAEKLLRSKAVHIGYHTVADGFWPVSGPSHRTKVSSRGSHALLSFRWLCVTAVGKTYLRLGFQVLVTLSSWDLALIGSYFVWMLLLYSTVNGVHAEAVRTLAGHWSFVARTVLAFKWAAKETPRMFGQEVGRVLWKPLPEVRP